MLSTLITDVTLSPLSMPLTEPFAIATGTQHTADNVLVRVVLADGTVGLGEAAPLPPVSGETQGSALAALEGLRTLALGRDARAWRPLAAAFAEAEPHQPAARCALEVAVLDALARHHRLPLWSFFGGAGTRVDIDMTVTAGDAAHARESARAILARGITTLKVKVGALDPEADAERMAAVHREAPGAQLLADANGGWSHAQAHRFLEELERRGVPLALFEQPVAADDYEGLRALTVRGTVPVCADESARSVASVLRLVRERCVSALNLKLQKCGVADALTVWSLARAAGLQLMAGAMVEGPLGISFATHFVAGLGGFRWADLDTHLFVARHPFTGGLRQEGATLDVGHVDAGHGVRHP